ncbi:MAG TPA: potassium-transporting ATPase subunit KdpB, partial [Terriglobales bacterium]|nr:potassium-transporting ATPase subunit KdpB [Terriglobales bacterium]
MKPRKKAVWEWKIVQHAIVEAFLKLSPRKMMGNPVMFVVEIGSVITTALLFKGGAEFRFNLQITLWLWFTVLFANFAEAMAEGRGRAQADTLRRARSETIANRIMANGQVEKVPSSKLCAGDMVFVSAGEFIPSDGEIVEGVASVDESAITGESAPVIREAGGDRSAVTGGTRVLSDRIKVKITSNPGETFLDRMIALVEGAERQKTPNEIALNILLAGLTIIFLLAVVTLQPFAIYAGAPQTVFVLVSLLVCLIPTTIGGLLSAIGIAGMDRLVQHNVLAMSGRAVEASGDVNTLLLDKTGTITLGNRQASRFVPAPGVTEKELADAAQLSSLADETPEGRSIVVLAKEKYNLRGRELGLHDARFVPFSAQTRMSGVDLNGFEIRKGATDAIANYVAQSGNHMPGEVKAAVEEIARSGGTPLVVAEKNRGALGVIELKDVVKGGMKERFDQLRAIGIRTVMITGDNPLTAAAIAREAGVDDFLAQATPKDKMDLIRREQAEGKLVAMTGDGTNDAPALKMADIGFSMGIAGTEVAKEASSIILMDDNFNSIVKALKWGRAVNDAVKRFLQFQLTVNVTAVILTFVTAVSSE